jgi:cytochrome P450
MYLFLKQTEVGIPLYSIQLNPSIFDNPYAFIPQRWLVENNEPDMMQRMRLSWMAFGHGARICIGKECVLPLT